MPSIFQPAPAQAHPLQAPMPPQLPADPEYEDLALGFECANPVLQFEHWEPQPHVTKLHY